jgi:toxin ParE1/3/4
LIQYTASALADIETAYNWYEDQREGLGDRFIADVRETAARIDANPKGYEKRIREARKANLKHFPYALWFKIENNNLVIACLHARRNPVLTKERATGIIPMPKPPGPS